MEDHSYLTVKQVAALLQLATVTVYRLVERGEMPGKKVGGTWRFSRAAIDAWINPPRLSAEALQTMISVEALQTLIQALPLNGRTAD